MYTPRHQSVGSLIIDQAGKVGVVVPTYNAAKHWGRLRARLDEQDIPPSQIVIIDSSSTDHTRSLARAAGYQVVRIRKEDFNHGATRQLACRYLPSSEILVYMTQDAVPARSDSIERLCRPFKDPAIGAVYGRQIPREDADPIERHGRLFNYPDTSQVRTLDSRKELGFKAVFFSNSFAAYRRTALEEVGGFPTDTIVSEEVTTVARMLMAGWTIAYQADAQVIHSHRLNLFQEFSRYFDVGVHHGRTTWLLDTFGRPGNDGLRYLKSELRFLFDVAPLWIPYASLRILSKYVAYQLGVRAQSLPKALCKAISVHPSYWDQPYSITSLAAGAEAQATGSKDETRLAGKSTAA